MSTVFYSWWSYWCLLWIQLLNSEKPNQMRGERREDQRCLAEPPATPPADLGMCGDCQTFPKLNISASDKLTMWQYTTTRSSPPIQDSWLRIFHEISWRRQVTFIVLLLLSFQLESLFFILDIYYRNQLPGASFRSCSVMRTCNLGRNIVRNTELNNIYRRPDWEEFWEDTSDTKYFNTTLST